MAIRSYGYLVSDFGEVISPAFGLITDRFSVGFKLKLMQMIYSRDVIASLCDLDEDVFSVAPGYPFFRRVGTVSEAVDYFQSISKDLSADAVDRSFAAASDAWNIFSWDEMARSLIGILCNPGPRHSECIR